MKICPHCESTKTEANGYCATFNRKVRKELENAEKDQEKRLQMIAKRAQFKPKQPIKKVSDKRKELNKKYFKLVEQFKKDNPHCKARVNEYCTKETADPHHMRGRGDNLLVVATWLPVCRSCHSYIEAHPEEAKEKGWSESRLAEFVEPHRI